MTTFTCPGCNQAVPADKIAVGQDIQTQQPAWGCPKCQHLDVRAQWGLSSENFAATDTFFHNHGKREPFGQGLFRAMARRPAFAASFLNLKSIRSQQTLNVDQQTAMYDPVILFNRPEKLYIRGRYFTPAQGGAPTKLVILLSGSAGVASHYFEKLVPRYIKRVPGVGLLMVDYRGFGRSEKKTPSSKGLYADAEAMFTYATSSKTTGGLGFAPGDVVIHGFSLGTGVAAELAAQHDPNFGGLILQCPFTSAGAMAGEMPIVGKIAKFITDHGTKMDVENKIASVTRPILLLIANDDGMRPHGDAIATRYQNSGNLTVGRYDGDHEDVHIAFKDGTGKDAISLGQNLQFKTQGPLATRVPAAKGDLVVKKRNITQDNQLTPDNVKTSSGTVGCIATILQFFNSI